ncbi:MAG: hypothetical protein AAGA77_03140 [Bacteroidota bacterium]
MKKLLFFSLLLVTFSNCKDKTNQLKYSFYDSGEKHEEYQYIADSIKEGIYRRYSKKGFLLETAHYKNGKLEGERVIYHQETGVKEISEIYQDDLLNGRYILFHPNGEMNMSGVYKNNVLSGTVSFYDTSGTLEKEAQFANNFELFPFQEFHENGNIKAEGNYRYSHLTDMRIEFGLLKEFDTNGELIRKRMCDENTICKTIWSRDNLN